MKPKSQFGVPGAGHSLTETIDFLRLLRRPLEHNVLKLFRAVADPTRNRLYVSGILTPHVGILDGASEQWVGTLDTRISGYALKYLALDTGANRLYIHNATNHTLQAVNIGSGSVVGPSIVPPTVGTMVADSRRGLLYLVTNEPPSFRVINGATLQLVHANNEMGRGINQIAYDEPFDTLYIHEGAPMGSQGRIFRFDPSRRMVTGVVNYALPMGQRGRDIAWDPVNQRFFVGVPNHSVLVLNAQGQEMLRIPLPRELEYLTLLYNPINARLVVLSLERPSGGQVSSTEGRLQVYDPNSGDLTAQLSFGKKIESITLNPATGKLYCPNGDTSTVWSIASNYGTVASLRLGDSLEQVVPAVGGRILYMNSRLGGSYLLEYDTETKSLETFEAGTWPIPLRTDATGKMLFVLNAWDSTLLVYALSPRRKLLGTVPLGLPRGSTDRLPDLAVDSRRAYIAYPEFATIAIVDWSAMRLLTHIPLAGFPSGSVGGGPGQLQLLVNEMTGRLFTFWLEQQKLSVFDLSQNYLLVDQIALPSQPPAGSAPRVNLLYLDSERNRLFVGALEVNGTTGRPTGRRLSRGQRVFALDGAAKQYWANAVEGQGSSAVNVVVVLDAETLASRAAYRLGRADEAVVPEYALDDSRKRLYVALMTTARLDVYTALKR